jgi:2',3'-cyclic-nucleotide 2'-phosphodiesterase (5'-nucleotidase family)
VLDTGDALIGGAWLGDLTDGEVIVAGMNLMGYDAMALGPKELLLGPDKLRQRMEEADFPMLSANVVLSGTTELVAEPFTILEVGDRRLGVIGLTRRPTPPLGDFQVLDPEQAAAHYVPEVAGQAGTVIVLTNMSYDPALALAEAIPGIDLLIAGLPVQLPSQAGRVPGTYTLAVTTEPPAPRHTGRYVGRLAVLAGGDGHLSEESWSAVPMNGTIVDDPQMQALIEKYRP